MKVLITLLTSLTLYFQYNLWFGKNGWTDWQQAKLAVSELQQENVQLKARNSQIEAEIDDLKKRFNALEERARFEREMIAPDEVFYRIVGKHE